MRRHVFATGCPVPRVLGSVRAGNWCIGSLMGRLDTTNTTGHTSDMRKRIPI